MPWTLNTWERSSCVPPYNSLATSLSVPLGPASSNAWRLTLRLVLIKLVSQIVGKTNFLSRSTLSSQSFPLSSDDVCLGPLVSSVDSPCLQTVAVFVFSPPPAHQLTPAGLCHVAIYISPESDLLSILIEYAPWSLTFYTAYSLGFYLSSTVASIPGMVMSYNDLRKNHILNWLFLHSSFRVNSRSSSIFIQARCFPS